MHKTTGEAGGTTAGEVERLVRLYSDSILRLSYSYLRSTHDAEDICQDVLLKLLTARPSFASDEHERAWVIRTTANACKDQLRAARRKDTTLEGAQEPATEGDPTFQGLLTRRLICSGPCANCRTSTGRSSTCTTSRSCPYGK